MNREALTHWIKTEVYEAGFSFCGISKAEFLEEEAPHLEAWLSSKQQGKMSYMEQYFDERLDPRRLVEGAKSVISVAFNYYPEAPQAPHIPQIAKYAYGLDYHYVLKAKLNTIIEKLKEVVSPNITIRAFVDSAPVLEKAWAKKSGLGWVGKNSNIIHPKAGSFFVLAELITDLELEYDGPIKDYCGTCTRCIDACPTQAIQSDKVVNGSQCISYFTIELKGALEDETQHKWDNWIFGCDICQDVCPWNRFSQPHSEPLFKPLESFYYTEDDWRNLSTNAFKKVFHSSPIKRAYWKGLQRNLNHVFPPSKEEY